MGQTQSTKISEPHGTASVSAVPKNENVHRRIDVQTNQTTILIWLDKNVNNQIIDYQNTIIQLRQVVNSIDIFTDGDQCIQFIQNIDNNKICIIISGSLGEHVVPQLHDMSQVDSILIFCSNKKYHETWVKDWPKIKGVFTDIKSICEALKQASLDCEQNAMPISFVARGEGSSKDLKQLDPSFMYTQIFKEILLTIHFEQRHFQEFSDHCRCIYADNRTELVNIEKFEKKYREKTPIWWYTYECFLYRMLNGALRLMDADLMIKLGFFIVDLHRHIEELHVQQFNGKTKNNNSIFTVYRGQGLRKEDFEKMQQTKGGLLSFNNFLSTSKDQTVSRKFARRALQNPDLVGILFVMSVDTSKSSTPFASINDVSYFKADEEEVLFSMHTIFQIDDIQAMDGNHRFFRVYLRLTDDNDPDLRAVTDQIRKESAGKGWFSLGVLLLKMGQFAKCQHVYEIILGQTTDDSTKAAIYHNTAWATHAQGKYEEAIKYYEKALEIDQNTLRGDDPNLALTYNNIGNVYSEMGEYWKALAYFQKSLEILQKSLPPDHPQLGTSYNNIGMVYGNMGEFSKALEYNQKDLEISQKTLPQNHPDLGASYNNMAMTVENLGDYSKAHSLYEHAVEIGQRSLPSDHPELQKWRNNLEILKMKMK